MNCHLDLELSITKHRHFWLIDYVGNENVIRQDYRDYNTCAV
jgi:hypothetical protein